MGRAEHIQDQIDYHEQRQRECLEVYYEAADRIAELRVQQMAVGRTVVRHLTLVPPLEGKDV